MLTKIVMKEDSKIKNRVWFTELEPRRMNILFGGNGSGKSTLLDDLSGGLLSNPHRYRGEYKRQFKVSVENKPLILVYSNSQNNYQRRGERNSDISNIFEVGRYLDTSRYSEGQAVIQSISDFLYYLTTLDKEQEYVIFMDEIDTGLDAINTQKLVRKIEKIYKDNPKLQFFISFNNYEMSKLDKEWLNMYTGQYEECAPYYEDFTSLLKALKKKYKRPEDTEIFK